MRRKLVNQKRDELRQLSRQELVNHIVDYPNQEFLNFVRGQDDERVKRTMPVGYIANNVKNNDYEMTDSQYYTLMHHFAKITVPEMKVVGITFYDNDPSQFKKDLVSQASNGNVKTYEMDYHLEPEPTNPYDKNAVKILVEDEVGEKHHIGYIARDFVAEHPITEPIVIEGTMVDYSNDHFSNISYRLAMDIEVLDAKQTKEQIGEFEQLSFADIINGLGLEPSDKDLNGIGDLGLDMAQPMEHIYQTEFELRFDVQDIDKANQVIDDIMYDTIRDDIIPQTFLEDVTDVAKINWSLQTPNSGIIEVITTRPFTETELDGLSEWISESITNARHSLDHEAYNGQTIEFTNDIFMFEYIASEEKGLTEEELGITEEDLQFAKESYHQTETY